MSFEIKDNGGAVVYIFPLIIISDLVFNDNLKYYFRDRYDKFKNNLLSSIGGNIYLLKFIFLMSCISSIVFKPLLNNCSKKKNDLDYSNAVFSKTTLLVCGIIFFQLTVYTLIKFILYKFGYYDQVILVKLMIFSSLLFLYIYYFLEMNEDKSCEEISDGETAGISLLLIFFVIYLILSTWFIRSYFSKYDNFFNILFFWDDKNVSINDNNNGQDNSNFEYDRQNNGDYPE